LRTTTSSSRPPIAHERALPNSLSLDDGVLCRCSRIKIPIPGSEEICSVAIGSKADIEASAKLGCRFCTMIYSAFNLSESEQPEQKRLSEGPFTVELSWETPAGVRCKLAQIQNGDVFAHRVMETDYLGGMFNYTQDCGHLCRVSVHC